LKNEIKVSLDWWKQNIWKYSNWKITGYVTSIRIKWTQLHYSIFWKSNF